MDIRVLGPVQVEDGATSVDIDSPKERAALVALALDPGRTVSSSQLIDGLWGSEPPETAEKTLQWHVSRLRKAIGSENLVTTSAGYSLDVPPGSVDAVEFAERIQSASRLMAEHRPAEARGACDSALALWRGEPFADLADGEMRLAQERRFKELHLLGREVQLEARLALGEHDQVVPDLEAFVVQHPYREQPWTLLMLALHRSGRQADSLRTYQRLRIRLKEDLGIDPPDAATALEERILRRDPQLDLTPPPPPHNLPQHGTSFVGREPEMESVEAAIARHALVSVIGAGGIGKSRLANEIGHRMRVEFPDGVWWVDLASATATDDLVAKTALAIGALLAGGPDPSTALTHHLRNRTVLIVLDNCEHLLPEVASLLSLLLGIGSVRVLATTRVAIAIPEEHRFVLPPLPSRPVANDPSPAASLFVDRSRSISGQATDTDEIAHVEELVQRIDGIPLSIELAAARSNVMSAAELAEHLSGSFDVPGNAADGDLGRHHSVGRVLDWSYDLLPEAEQHAFDLLGVFRGSFDLEAATAVLGHRDRSTTIAVLEHLLDTSMAIRDRGAGTRRFRLLEPLRLYALSHLSREERGGASNRHCDHYRAMCTNQGLLGQTDVIGWRRRIWLEDHNIMAAIEWALENEPEGSALAFGDAIGQALYRRGEYVRCVELLDTMLASAPDSATVAEALARSALVWPLFLMGDAQRAFQENRTALDIATEFDEHVLIGWCLWNEAHMLMLGLSDFEHARPLYDRTVDLVREDPDGVGFLYGLAFAGRSQARALMGVTQPNDREDLAVAEQRLLELNDLSGVAHVWMARWLVDLNENRFDGALDSARANVRYAREAKDPVYEQIGLSGMATSLFLLGRIKEAYDLEFEAVRICQETNNIMQLSISLVGLAAIGMRVGAWEDGAKLWGAGQTIGAPWPIFANKHAADVDRCRIALGDRFDELVAEGGHLAAEEAVAIAALLPVE